MLPTGSADCEEIWLALFECDRQSPSESLGGGPPPFEMFSAGSSQLDISNKSNILVC